MLYNFSNKFLFICGTTAINFCIYWGYGLLYLIPDLYHTFLHKYKIQPNKKPIQENPYNIYDITKLVVFNQLVVTPFIASILYNFYTNDDIIPTYNNIFRDITISVFITEILFYYTHRLFHISYLYKYIHKLHHVYSAPIGITALYAHPIEYAIGNILPIMIGPLLCSSHIITIWIWIIIVNINTITVHSGYNFFYLIDSTKHDKHHMMFICNYGVLNILDYLHGTLK